MFQTPFSRYRYRRTSFGISSASKVFQRKHTQTFRDIQGVNMIHDDMIIAGVDESVHQWKIVTVQTDHRSLQAIQNKPLIRHHQGYKGCY